MRSGTFNWFGIFRLGLVQMAIGAIVVLTTSTMNRVLVVELALPASLPGLLVGWHYAVQISRPRWGFGADQGGNREGWIIGGMAVLALGALLAAVSAWWIEVARWPGIALSIGAFTLIGAGVGAAGTNLLALLAIKTPAERKAAAAAIVWIMMIVGFILTTGIAGSYLDPFSMPRLVAVTASVAAISFLMACLALWRLAPKAAASPSTRAPSQPAQYDFKSALSAVWQDQQTRYFTLFIFVSMLAYSAQDLILEPFAGLLYGYTPGQSTQLAATQNSGVLVGMIATAIIGTLIGRSRALFMRRWALVGCLVSALALGFLVIGALQTDGFPLKSSVFSLGVGNGMFAVAAIGSMITLASASGEGREGIRMGIWGAAQAVAFGIGGLIGAAALDLIRILLGDMSLSFAMVFGLEGVTFIIAGWLGLRVGETETDHDKLPFLPAEPLPAE